MLVGPHGGGVWGRVEGKGSGSDFNHFYSEVLIETETKEVIKIMRINDKQRHETKENVD
jgi:hypothetical protein